MGEAGRLSDLRELKILRQLKRQFRKPVASAGSVDPVKKKSLVAMVGGKPAFLLEWTVTGDVYLTGPPALHASPWRALEAWGESMRYLVEEENLSEVRIPLIPLRAAEIRAVQRLGCRRERRAVGSLEEVWVGSTAL
jgi:hypothetical protein